MKLSDFELEVMQLMWKQGTMTAPEVHNQIAARRKVAYSTVKTIIDRLEDKGALLRAKTYGRTIVYQASITKDSLSQPMLRSFVDKLFLGNFRALFNHALKEEDLTLDDISYLENLLADKRKNLEGQGDD